MLRTMLGIESGSMLVPGPGPGLARACAPDARPVWISGSPIRPCCFTRNGRFELEFAGSASGSPVRLTMVMTENSLVQLS